MSSEFDLVAHAKSAARDALNSLDDPEDDILPVILSYGPRGLDIMGTVMPNDDAGKASLADVMMAKIAIAQASEAAMICTAYVSKVDTETRVIASRQETIVLVHCTVHGQQAWTADITRHSDRPPDMSIWRELGSGAVAGRFAEAMTNGLAFAGTVDSDIQEILDAGYKEDRVDDLVRMFLAAKDALQTRGLDEST